MNQDPRSINDRRLFWTSNQPGLRFTESDVGSERFFREIEDHRYSLEPHIPRMVRFERWSRHDVLEAGCGIGTDGAQFARAGARYTGIDFTTSAVELARRRFAIERLRGNFARASVLEIPFPDATFDLVFSHGVIHHLPQTERAVQEFHRVLRPGGTALVMLYHRNSLNYRVGIMLLRRLLVSSLLIPGAIDLLLRFLPEQRSVLEGHVQLLRNHGARYIIDRELFLSNNTDGPGNPLSKVYSREQATQLFHLFAQVRSDVRFLNLRIIPGGARIAQSAIARRLERKVGWHLYVEAQKAGT